MRLSVGDPIHHVKSPIPIGDSTHDLPPNWQWQAIFGSDPAAPGKHAQKAYRIFIRAYQNQKSGSSKDLK
jgi:hypothetical protein